MASEDEVIVRGGSGCRSRIAVPREEESDQIRGEMRLSPDPLASGTAELARELPS